MYYNLHPDRNRRGGRRPAQQTATGTVAVTGTADRDRHGGGNRHSRPRPARRTVNGTATGTAAAFVQIFLQPVFNNAVFHAGESLVKLLTDSHYGRA
jgi:hypothetical protein